MFGFIPKRRFDEVNAAKKQLEKDIEDLKRKIAALELLSQGLNLKNLLKQMKKAGVLMKYSRDICGKSEVEIYPINKEELRRLFGGCDNI